MKYSRTTIVCILLLTLIPFATYAEGKPVGTGASTTTPADQLKKDRDEIQQRQDAQMREVMKRQAAKVWTRIEATIERMDNIMSRVLTRVEKIKNAGGDTTAAEKNVADAKTSLDSAKASFALLGTSIDAFASSTSQTASSTASGVKNLRTISQSIEKNLQKTQKSLEKAVGSLKGVSLTATSTRAHNQ